MPDTPELLQPSGALRTGPATFTPSSPEMPQQPGGLGTAMPMPAGTAPTPPPVDPSTGIPLTRASGSTTGLDAASQRAALRAINDANRATHGQPRIQR